MKHFILSIAAVIGLLFLGACSTMQSQNANAQIQKLAADLKQYCPLVQGEIASAKTILSASSPAAVANITKYSGYLDAACAAGATVSDLSSLANAGTALALNFISASSMPAADKQKYTTDVLLLQGAINTFLALQPSAAR